MEPQNKTTTNRVDEKLGLYYMIFDSIMSLEELSTKEYWKIIFNCVKSKQDGNPYFLAEPQWGEIENWLVLKSFKFNIKSTQEFIHKKFKVLIETCNAFVRVSQSDFSEAGSLCFDYLSAYYDLIIGMEQVGLLRDDLSYNSAFLQMMMTGNCQIQYNSSGEFEDYFDFYGFYSPVFLEKLCLFYDFLNEDEWYNKKSDKKMIMMIFKDVIQEKFIHMFFSDVNIANKRYVNTYHNVTLPYLINRDNLSSVEPIRPVRWVEKVRSYIECLDGNKEGLKKREGKYVIKIAAIGYVNIFKDSKQDILTSDELDMFCHTLNSFYNQSDYVFEVKVYVNAKDNYFFDVESYDVKFPPEPDNPENYDISITLQKVDYSVLFAPNKPVNENSELIKDVINQNNIVLILDVPNLYTHEYKLLRKSSNNFPNEGSYNNYTQEYCRLDFKNDDFLVLGYRYAPIHFLVSKLNLIAMNADAYEDTLKYKINIPLINYLRAYVKDEGEYLHDVFVFISSKSSINYSEYAEQNFTREERYNGKNFHLIMLRNMKKKTIRACDAKKNYIVFSLWNLMKNIDYHMFEKPYFFDDVLHSEPTKVCAYAMQVYIKMKWGDSLKNFEFEICLNNLEIKKQIDRASLKDLVEELLTIVFSSRNDLFSRCIRHAFSNTIYSQMQYLDDAIFYCLFCSEFPRKDAPKLLVDFMSFKEEPVYSVNQPVFWNIVRTLKSLNTKAFFGDQFLAIKREFRNNCMDYSIGGYDSVVPLLQLVELICEKYGYEDSYLYRNICGILE